MEDLSIQELFLFIGEKEVRIKLLEKQLAAAVQNNAYLKQKSEEFAKEIDSLKGLISSQR